MIQISTEVNTPVSFFLTVDIDGVISQSSFSVIDIEGVVVSPAIEFTDTVIENLVSLQITFQETGIYAVVVGNVFKAQIEVVSKSIMSSLKDIEDEALGSWSWNKVNGTLTMLRQDGTALATFAVVDNLTESSRERIS